jgi:hypothetical protein
VLLGPREGRAGDRFRGIVDGTLGVGTLEASERRTFTEFNEEGSIEADYAYEAGPGFEVGLEYLALDHLGFQAAYSWSKRDATASYSASFPHPFFFDQPRLASGDVPGLEYTDGSFHLDLVATGRSGALELTAFAGVTFFKVRADVIESVPYTHAYPYDAVEVSNVPTKTSDVNATGLNVGARLDYRFGRSRTFGVGASARFSRATVDLPTTEGVQLGLDVGGLRFGAGLRLYF